MKTARVLFWMMRADFLERTRRYSFLVMLLAAVFLGFSVNNGTIQLIMGEYRGVYNSAWMGGMMALVIVTFLGWFGFYLVKNGVERDVRTGVGQILATTPLRKAEYTLGKWLSNFALLAALCVVLLAAAFLMQLLQREEPHIDLWALSAPFLFVALPLMALVAAAAIWFETIPFLRGGFGNLVYFFLFTFVLVFAIENFGRVMPAFEPLGLRLITGDMAAQLQAVEPGYNAEEFTLGAGREGAAKTFRYAGMAWTPGLIALRLSWIAISAVLAAAAALPFHRFDPSALALPRIRRRRAGAQAPAGDAPVEIALPPAAEPAQPPSAARLTPLAAGYRGGFARLVLAELRLLLRGQPWFWYAGAVVIFAGSLLSPPEAVRSGWVLAAAIWPVLLWSQLGAREQRWNTGQIVFSAPRPLLRLLAAGWLAGVLAALLQFGGALLTLLRAGDLGGGLALLLASASIPALALCLGAWSGSSKLFEVLYLLLWYIGPLNRMPALDFLGVHPAGLARAAPPLLLAAAAALLLLAVAGRRRQVV